MEQYKLFDAEYKFINIIWENEPVNSTELSRICFQQLGWKKSTTFNMIRRLCERNILQSINATVTSILKQEQIQKYESVSIIEKSFSGSLPLFLTAFLEEKKITEQEASELKRIIEEATK
ncbi:MAG: BlaI/MecI/CopY family transcriptional regulator [Saccharofermentanales bacterium]